MASLVLLTATLAFLWHAKPPNLIRVGAQYTAKIVCSNVFLARRDPAEVLKFDVQAPGHSLLRFMRVTVDGKSGVVRASLFGFIGGGMATLRPDSGCTVSADGRALPGAVDPRRTLSPAGAATDEAPAATDGRSVALRRVLADDALAGPGLRAIVVVHDGYLVAERYAQGFDRTVPQLGWSMTKSVTAGLIGLLVRDGRVRLDQPAGWATAKDGRERITVSDLMSMSSGLEFNEGYGAVSDVTRMLYLEPDMAAFAQSKPRLHAPGEVWEYSSGSAVIVARVFQSAVEGDAVEFARTRLFAPLGMTSAVMETDEAGTLVGSSTCMPPHVIGRAMGNYWRRTACGKAGNSCRAATWR